MINQDKFQNYKGFFHKIFIFSFAISEHDIKIDEGLISDILSIIKKTLDCDDIEIITIDKMETHLKTKTRFRTEFLGELLGIYGKEFTFISWIQERLNNFENSEIFFIYDMIVTKQLIYENIRIHFINAYDDIW